ncbi:Por secretion system C-terminal sorting domain-containing protein [Kaistella treverensis]|uniref:Por secretion system C-terminal sorting domain-containing protein n=1 Tax=Kaistella treverensis TaxID=631455 RepID=A0A1I3N0Q4_9FLAO|nr:T9SS type A sorting domain-containing protein [Kaistella treverensis]SFJ02843.1 Por secretion system C-terminal sorting domain-containing protein [Kaistella treverensis]
MKKNLLTVGFLSLSLSMSAQALIHVDNGGNFYVGEYALVYNGGGIQTKGNGIIDLHGNLMIVGDATDGIRTYDAAGIGEKTDGRNIIVRINSPLAVDATSYGQLYIDGIPQSNITGIVDREYKTLKHGTYQQVALPFFNKPMASLDSELGKNFTDVRRSQNEILIWDNDNVEADNFSTSNFTLKGTTYYMLGSKDFNSASPLVGDVFTLRGIPFANGVKETMVNAGAEVDFGPTGNMRNSYSEPYNTYLQDAWDAQLVAPGATPYSVPTYGKNIYQYGNPYLVNLDLKFIGRVESGATTDGNNISAIQGIRLDPGGVVSNEAGATWSVNADIISFTNDGFSPIPVGDVDVSIQPMEAIAIKLRNNDPEVGSNRTLNFDGLRRFNPGSRNNSTPYSPTAEKMVGTSTVKQLGVIALDANGKEMSRAYYVVYENGTTGHSSKSTTQAVLGSQNIIGTYEEDAVNGGIDDKVKDAYWLYINEANEKDFFGKAIPLMLYNRDIKSLKFEIRENAELIDKGQHTLSTGIGFYYKDTNGEIKEASQNSIVPVRGDKYSLFYGKATTSLGTDNVVKPSRTRVVYNPSTDGFFVRFDPNWKKADVQVYDMSGKLIISNKNVETGSDYNLKLSKQNSAYIVTALSETGEKFSTKIIR